MQRVNALLLLLSLLVGCDQAPTDSIRFALSAAPATLDPRFASDATSARLTRLLYDRLVDFDHDFQPKARMASWKRLTPTHYRFFLDPRRRPFVDGSVLTASHVKTTYDFIRDASNASPHAGIFKGIARIETPDEQTVDFHLKAADKLFPGYLTIGIVAQGGNERVPMGNGAFAFEDWSDDDVVSLRRRADGQAVRFVVAREPSVRVLKLLRGEVDLLQNDLSPELFTYLASQPEITMSTAPGINFSYMGFNLADALTGRLEFRRAVAHAIDRQSLIKYLWQGRVRPAEAMLVPEHWAGVKDIEPIGYDPVEARRLVAKLLAEGLGENGHLKLVFKTTTDPFRLRIATLIQHQLEEVGIHMEIRSYDWGTFFGDIKAGRFQMYSLSWVGVQSPDIFRYVFHSESLPPVGANRGRFVNAEVDALIERAEAAATLDQMIGPLRDLQLVLHRELPYIPLWYESQLAASGPEITGYKTVADGNYDAIANVEKR